MELFLGVWFLLASCSDQPRDSAEDLSLTFYKDRYRCNELISIDLTSLKNELPISSLISRVELIPLETVDNSVIGRPGSVVVTKDRIYMVDNANNRVVAFDTQGSFIEVIEHIGDGKGEYLHLIDIVFNPYSGKLELLDAHGKLLAYDFDNGLHEVAEVPQLNRVHRVGIIDEDLIVFYTGYESHLLHFYSRGRSEIIGSALEVDFDMRRIRSDIWTKLYKRGDALYFLDIYGNAFFKLNGSKLDGHYCFDFGTNNFSIASVPSEIDNPWDFLGILKKFDMVFPISYVHVTNGDLKFLSVQYDGTVKTLIYDSGASRVSQVRLNFIRDFAPSYVESEKSNVLYAYSTKELLSNLDDDLLTPESRRIIVEATDNDNPIMVKMEIRN